MMKKPNHEIGSEVPVEDKQHLAMHLCRMGMARQG
jgi:hypothetical protein